MERPRTAKMLLIGETGNGKSSLGNFILGLTDSVATTKAEKLNFDLIDNPQMGFVVSKKPDSCTSNTKGKHALNDDSIFVIDTPGFLDSSNQDSANMKEMCNYLKNNPGLQLIVIVFNFHCPRLNSDIKKLIRFLCKTFPRDIENHIAIVFNKYSYQEPPDENQESYEEFQNSFVPEIVKVIYEETHRSPNTEIPTYFTNSKDKDLYSKREIDRLIAQARGCGVIDKIEQVKIGVRYEDVRQEEVPSSRIEDGTLITTVEVWEIKTIYYYNREPEEKRELLHTYDISKRIYVPTKENSGIDYIKAKEKPPEEQLKIFVKNYKLCHALSNGFLDAYEKRKLIIAWNIANPDYKLETDFFGDWWEFFVDSYNRPLFG